MTLLHQGSRLGERPHYVAPPDHIHAPTLLALLDALDDDARDIDPVGLRQYFDRSPDGIRTCFRRARRLPAGCDVYRHNGTLDLRQRPLPAADGALLPLLEERIAALLRGTRNPVIALSGGLDSALMLALVQRVGGTTVPCMTLATGLPGYCELEDTLQAARNLGVNDVEVIPVSPEDLVRELPSAITACETPLFNLHPVSKLILARAAAQRGHDTLLTGDGADQVFAGSDARNYLPIVGAITRAAGVTLASLFFDEQVIAWTARHGTDPQKTALRAAAATILPEAIAWRKKQPRLAPDFCLQRYRDPQLEARLAPRLALPPPGDALSPGPVQTLWATSAILLRHLGGTL